ncbi:MAG: hypothetical protein IBX60_09235 [Candidatus Aminicenantes bacterium]|nr:hypothetical protein [Candidatus Aminicenantes bacterium]
MISYTFSQELVLRMALPVIGRLGHATGEGETPYWGKRILGLQGLLGTDFKAEAFLGESPKRALEAHLKAILMGIYRELLPGKKTWMDKK